MGANVLKFRGFSYLRLIIKFAKSDAFLEVFTMTPFKRNFIKTAFNKDEKTIDLGKMMHRQADVKACK